MSRFHKIISGILSVAILCTLWVGALAADTSEDQISFSSFSGIVKEIHPFLDSEGKAVEGWQYILTENEEGAQTNFLVTTDTYWVTGTEISAGVKITGFYNANSPTLMIYPPQYKAEVMAVDLPEGQRIKADRFDENLVSADNQLKLNISDKTEIVLQNGEAFTGELGGNSLVVLYDFSDDSLPAQTNPLKVIVFVEKAIQPVPNMTEEEIAALAEMVPTMDIVVNNRIIDASAAYVKEDGTVMVPLRAIAEALGFEVTWDHKLRSAMLDNIIMLTIDRDYYTYAKTAPIQLGAAPQLREGSTFVPLQFFRTVARINNAYVFEGQIVIDQGEKME